MGHGNHYNIHIQAHKHCNYRRTLTQNLLKFRGEIWRMTCQTTLTTLHPLWSLNSGSSTDEHSSHMHWLTVLTLLLFKEFIENSENILLRVQTSKNRNILISQSKELIRLWKCNFPKATERKKSILHLC